MALSKHWWPAPNKGEFPSFPPDDLPAGGARELRNYLVHHDGRVVPRGSIGGSTALLSGSLAQPAGGVPVLVASYYGILSAQYRAGSAVPTVDAWRVPINKPAAAAQLTTPIVGADALGQATLKDGVTSFSAQADIGRVTSYRAIPSLDAVYGMAQSGTATAVPDGFAPLTRVNKRPISLTGVVLHNGPGFVQDIFYHYDRLFVLAARRPGSTTEYDHGGLFWTIPGGTTGNSDLLSDWQEPVSGLVNTIKVGNPIAGDFGVGMGRAAGQLVIFMRKSVWVLYGTNPDDFTLRQLRPSHGCIDPRSIVTVPEGVIFASPAGLELFDGTKFTLLSRPVADQWLEFSNRGPGADSVNHSYIRCTELPNRYLFVALGTDPNVAFGTGGAERSWLYHLPTGAWIQLAGSAPALALGAAGAFTAATVGENDVELWGGARWARCDRLTFGLQTGVGLRDIDPAGSYAVDLDWKTGLADLGRVWNTAKLTRMTADYRQTWVDDTGTIDGQLGTVQLRDSAGDIGTPLALPGSRPTGAPLRRRPVEDTHHELPRGDVEARARCNTGGNDAALRTGELAVYGLGLEYEPDGRNRRL